MSKYIIDTETWANLFEVQRVGVYGIGNDIVTDEKTVWSRMFRLDELEELNSDYINEHYGELQDEAYQAGMDKAWEATKKIFGYEIDGAIPIADIGNVFGYEPCKAFCTADILRDFTVQEAIAKLKAYEDGNHSDRIEVGDEVISDNGTKFTVTSFTDMDSAVGISGRGLWCFNAIDRLTKTGKHYDIASILEAMRE